MDKILKQKNIDTIYHFTRAENIINIFKYGIIPREILDRQEIVSCYNDEYRYDGCMDAVCTSIEFPNYKMFYKLRQENPGVDWVVLKLDAQILCDFQCAYCWTNAGDASMYNIPIEERMGVDSFLELFINKEGYPKREDLHIYDWYPTNPQAEVLVFGIIPINYMRNIFFETDEVRQRYLDIIPGDVASRVCKDVFCPRKDWEAWRS